MYQIWNWHQTKRTKHFAGETFFGDLVSLFVLDNKPISYHWCFSIPPLSGRIKRHRWNKMD